MDETLKLWTMKSSYGCYLQEAAKWTETRV